MALKSKRPAASVSRSGTKSTLSIKEEIHHAGITATKASSKRRRGVAVETIEARLERKATAADTKAFVTESLGQMTREKRHRLLYGD